MKNPFWQKVDCNMRVPAFLAPVWYIAERNQARYILFPFHLLVIPIHDLWVYLRIGMLRCPVDSRRAYAEGFAAGRASAKKETSNDS